MTRTTLATEGWVVLDWADCFESQRKVATSPSAANFCCFSRPTSFTYDVGYIQQGHLRTERDREDDFRFSLHF